MSRILARLKDALAGKPTPEHPGDGELNVL